MKKPEEQKAYPTEKPFLTNFLDTLYAATIAFSFTIIHNVSKGCHFPFSDDVWAKIVLFVVALTYIVRDWVGARLINKDYPYLIANLSGKLRFICDFLVAILFFVLISCASRQSSFYILSLAGIIFTGALWATFLKQEYSNKFLASPAKKETVKYDLRLHGILITHYVASFALGALWLLIYIKRYHKEPLNLTISLVTAIAFSLFFALYYLFIQYPLPSKDKK